MKKLRLLSTLFFISLFSTFLFAQVGVEVSDEFYFDSLGWYLKGYVKTIPQVKPYPVFIVEDILNQVLENGEKDDQAKALDYRSRFFEKKWHVSADGNADIKIKIPQKTDSSLSNDLIHKELYSGGIYTAGDFLFKDFFALSYSVGVRGFNNNVALEQVNPKYIYDSRKQKLKPFAFDIGDVSLLPDAKISAFLGNKNLFVTAGLNKVGYSLFPYSDLVLNPNSYQLLNTSFNYYGQRFSYVQLFALLTSNGYSQSYKFNKFLSFHSIRFPFFKERFTISLFESAVFGDGFVPQYIMPVPFFIMNKIDGSQANVLAGIDFTWKPIKSLALNSEILISDIGIKDFIKFHWNSAHIRSALRFGAIYSPENSICNLMSIDYTLVTPYTYTAYVADNDSYNTKDYVNAGMCIGSELPPNSDRVIVRLEFKPFSSFKISSFTSFVRHSNPYLSLSDQEVVDLIKSGAEFDSSGSVKTDTRGMDSAESYTNFLRQDTVMYTVQVGVTGEYEFLATRNMRVSVIGGYRFEYTREDGIDTPIYKNVALPEDDLDGTLSIQAVKDAREAWLSSLVDSFNNYLTIGFKIIY